MAITKKQPGEAAGVAAAGKAVGQAQRAEEERARAERARVMQIQHEWQIQMALLNEQQDFAHEQRMHQVELDKEARAHEWEKEKAEFASKLDFEYDEKERIRDKELYRAGRDTLDKNKGNMSELEYKKARFELDKIFAEKRIPEAAAGLGYEKPKTENTTQFEQMWSMMSPEQRDKYLAVYSGLEPRAGRPRVEKPKTYAEAAKEIEARDLVMSRIPSFTDTDLAQLGLTREGLPSKPDLAPVIDTKTEEEYNALPAGTRVRLPDGTIVTKR